MLLEIEHGVFIKYDDISRITVTETDNGDRYSHCVSILLKSTREAFNIFINEDAYDSLMAKLNLQSFGKGL